MSDERRHRFRVLNKPRFIGQWHNWPGDEEATDVAMYSPLETAEHCWDYTHTRGKDGKYHDGDPYSSQTILISRIPSGTVSVHRPGLKGHSLSYEGGLTSQVRGNNYLDWGYSPEDYFANLWQRAKPDHPQMRLANAIYELREIPELLHQRFQSFKDIPDLHLAYQFGYRPLMNDVRDFVVTHFAAKKALDQLIRDEGRPVRRTAKTVLRDDTYVYSGESYQCFDQNFVTQCYYGVPKYYEKHWENDIVRFAGRFRYSLPGGPRDWRWQAWMIARIFGLDVTPSNVYKAIPWSWLVDWFSSVGDMVDNMSAQVVDRLSADYAFVTVERKHLVTSVNTLNYYESYDWDGPKGSATATTYCLAKTTNRVQANAFGNPFGGQVSLNAMQGSILGALGLSRMKTGGGAQRFTSTY